eukprot:TRINITY_DN28581_c0_g1_i1.p1 TRINITY_DN28581_c0_g1~~TRINITY_DN28581_c0_g1_i1.p1  ORF type:complete len:363 (+),score=58.60 TRINITY_DN28581_c0_g1_i1:71-1090(+)
MGDEEDGRSSPDEDEMVASGSAASSLAQCNEEALLGSGILLPRPDGTVRLFVLSRKRKRTRGTVLILHGSSAVDWLGCRGEKQGQPALGGCAELALALRHAGLTAVLLDSYFDGRRERIGGVAGTDKRVSDVLAALMYLESHEFPKPFHLYGKSNGGWVVLKLLAALGAGDGNDFERERKDAEWAVQAVKSCILNCPFVSSSVIPRLAAAANDPKVSLPPLLLLVAEEDCMPTQYGEAVDVAVRATEALACGAEPATETECVEVEADQRPSTCHIRSYMAPDGHSVAMVRSYSGIGHTFVMDGTHKEITDGSCKAIVQNTIDTTASWCRAFGRDIWSEA